MPMPSLALVVRVQACGLRQAAWANSVIWLAPDHPHRTSTDTIIAKQIPKCLLFDIGVPV